MKKKNEHMWGKNTSSYNCIRTDDKKEGGLSTHFFGLRVDEQL